MFRVTSRCLTTDDEHTRARNSRLSSPTIPDIMPNNHFDKGEGKIQDNANNSDPCLMDSDTHVDESRLLHPGTVSYPAGAGHDDK
jgi:hypothetical protein